MAEGGRLLCFAHAPLFGQQTFLFLLWFLAVFFLSFIALEIAMLGKGKGAYDTVLRCGAAVSLLSIFTCWLFHDGKCGLGSSTEPNTTL